MAKKDKTKKGGSAPAAVVEPEISMDDFKDVSVMPESEVPVAEPQPYTYPTPKESEADKVEDEVPAPREGWEEAFANASQEEEDGLDDVVLQEPESATEPEKTEERPVVAEKAETPNEGVAEEAAPVAENTSDETKPVDDALAIARRKRNQRRIIRVHSANFTGWCHNN